MSLAPFYTPRNLVLPPPQLGLQFLFFSHRSLPWTTKTLAHVMYMLAHVNCGVFELKTVLKICYVFDISFWFVYKPTQIKPLCSKKPCGLWYFQCLYLLFGNCQLSTERVWGSLRSTSLNLTQLVKIGSVGTDIWIVVLYMYVQQYNNKLKLIKSTLSVTSLLRVMSSANIRCEVSLSSGHRASRTA